MKKALFTLAFCSWLLGGLAVAADGDLVPNRLSVAKVGEWASYRIPDGYIQKLTVIGRSGEGDDAAVTVKVENMYDGKVVDSKEITQEAGPPNTAPIPPDDEGATVAVRTDTVKLGAKMVTAGVVEIIHFFGADDPDNSVTEWWVSSDVPVFGIVKKVVDGETEWELDQFGFAG